ncbi:hypothetical protein BDN72DRAFT_843022 [Pluteus cervinus]|uniref:Uncharacterized protein n=1 Tax=Pluteus cervinus TaxID=181527 RepID=A0ACD3AP17_9AGAR|nr:hypothetical protein BDN72DRAFT_843022 [Pluteus cervinus]
MPSMRTPGWASQSTSPSTARRKALAQSKAIDEDIESQERIQRGSAEALVLGLKDSGASTFVTQMMLQKQPDSVPESILQECQPLVVAATIESCKALARCLTYMNHPLGRAVETMFAPTALDGNTNDISPGVADQIDDIWRKSGLQKLILESLFHVEHPVHTTYFLDHVKRLLFQQYFPTPSDILRVDRPLQGSVNTTTIQALYTPLIFHEMSLQMFLNSKKMTLMAECVDFVVFFVDMSNYQNILDSMIHVEALGIQGGRLHSRGVTLGFFLNNIQTFEQKVQKIPLQSVFPNYIEGAIPSKAISYIRGEFSRRAKDPHGNTCYFCVGDVLDPRAAEILLAGIVESTRRRRSAVCL